VLGQLGVGIAPPRSPRFRRLIHKAILLSQNSTERRLSGQIIEPFGFGSETLPAPGLTAEQVCNL
jgi:hypothetical protein